MCCVRTVWALHEWDYPCIPLRCVFLAVSLLSMETCIPLQDYHVHLLKMWAFSLKRGMYHITGGWDQAVGSVHVHHHQNPWLKVGRKDGHHGKQWLHIRGHILHQCDQSCASSTPRTGCVGPWNTPTIRTAPVTPPMFHLFGHGHQLEANLIDTMKHTIGGNEQCVYLGNLPIPRQQYAIPQMYTKTHE